MYVLSRNITKNIYFFLSENVHFLEVKFSIYLNRRVCVMAYTLCHTINHMDPKYSDTHI